MQEVVEMLSYHLEDVEDSFSRSIISSSLSRNLRLFQSGFHLLLISSQLIFPQYRRLEFSGFHPDQVLGL